MEGDPLRPVAARTRLGDAVTSEVLNALKLSARIVRDEWLPAAGGSVDPFGIVSYLPVLIRNDSGGDMAAFSVLKITGVAASGALTNEPFDFQRRVFLAGETPDNSGNVIAL